MKINFFCTDLLKNFCNQLIFMCSLVIVLVYQLKKINVLEKIETNNHMVLKNIIYKILSYKYQSIKFPCIAYEKRF